MRGGIGRGFVVHRTFPPDEPIRHLTNHGSRGVVMESGQTIAALCEERHPLYARYAEAVSRIGGR